MKWYNILGPNNADLASPLFNDKPASDALTVFNIKLPKDVVSQYDLKLAGLSVSGASLKPVFNPAYKEYFTTIPAGITSVEVTATPQDATATVTGAGTVNVSDGKGTITVTVTASDPQYTREYSIHYLSDTELTMAHSYTFDDGTANDQVGGADGTVHGGTFADEGFISAKEGDYIILPAAEIALNTFPSITMEAHVMTGVNPAWTMLAYFGGLQSANSYWMSIARNDNVSMTEINTGGVTNVSGAEPGAGETHHYVSVVSSDSIFWYIDGSLVRKVATGSNVLISKISNANGWLAFGGWNDPTWIGTIYEFDIYSGQMDAATVAQRAIHFLGGIPDATLASLTVDTGELIPAFDPAVTSYSVIIPAGTSTVNVSAVTNSSKSTLEGDGAVDVSSGNGSASVVVTAENGATKTYTIGFSTPTDFTLMHSYTFEDGTATDVVGDADGTLVGAGTIANGAYTAAANGDYIELPAATIAINTYAAITLEGFIYADIDNTGSTMMAYFGGNENNLGGNGYFFTPDRNAESRTAISCGNITAPWSAEQGVTGAPVSVGEKHHVVSVLTNSSIKWYIDGILAGDAVVSGANSIAGISNVNAWLCKGGYTADPTWMGTIDEFNVYNGVLDAATIAERAQQYLGGGGLTLMHSYTFEDGTANDVVGTAHGTLEGDAAVADGSLTLSGTGFVTLPGVDINIASYSSITFEGVFNQAVGMTDKFTAIASFGDVNPTVDWMGINYIIMQPTRQDNANSRTSISCLNTTDPWATENGVNGAEIADTLTHHFVTIITGSEIKLYIDGVLIGTSPLTGNNSLANVGKTVALIGKDVYPGDPLWQGSVDELNIYEGEMDSATIAERAKKFMGAVTLMHSYTFEDGTANDVVGTAHGTLEGDAAVSEGMLTLSGTGFVTLPGVDINIASYSSITFEGVFNQAEGMTDKFTAIASFGDVNPTVDWMGINYIIMQPTRQDNANSRTSISCLNTTDPWATENGVNGAEITDTKTHHFVTVINESEIKLYIDGVLIGTAPLTGNNSLANVGKTVALIGKDVYPGDPLWQGSVDELNIYDGEMDAATIAQRANDFTTGISDKEINEASILVYPTYSSGDFTVKTSGNKGMITVYNMVGKLVLQRMIESSEQKVTLQSEGMYLMRVESEGVAKTFKVFKTK